MSHCRRHAAATSHQHIYRHSFRDACKYFVGAAAGHITLKVAASRRSLHACAHACSAFARQAFVPCRVKICLSKTLPSYASVDAGYDDNGGSGGGHDDEDCNNDNSVVFEDVL
jgi:hypothetical protein